MCSISKLDDQLNQLQEEVRNFYRMSYNPAYYRWGRLDYSLRFIDEHIATAIVYALYGNANEQDATLKLKKDENPNEIFNYGAKLIKVAISVLKDHCSQEATIIDWIESDVSTHNENSHGNAIFEKEKEEDAQRNIAVSLPLLIKFFNDDFQNSIYFDSYIKGIFKEIAWSLINARKLIEHAPIDLKIKEKIHNCIYGLFKSHQLP